MKTTTLITHGTWAALAVGAFLLGRTPHPDEADPDGTAGGQLVSGMSPAAVRSAPTSWTSGPGDSPTGFSDAMAAALSETDEELWKTQAVGLMSELTPQVLDGLTEEMVPGILQLFAAAGGYEVTWHKQEAFFGAWARLNPEAAFAYVTDPKNKRVAYSSARSAVIEEWAKINMSAAQDALAGLESDNDRHNMGNHLMSVLLESDLDASVAYSARLWKEEGSTSGIYRLVKNLRQERGIEGVQEWLANTGASELGDNVVAYKQEAVEWLAYRGTQAEIAGLLAANADDPFVDSDFLQKVARELTRKAENRARAELDVIANLPDIIGAKGQALGERFESYMKEDFEGAGAWLDGQKRGPQHDEAIEIFVRSATMDDVPTAMLWADQIRDPELRSETIQFVQERGG